MQVSKVSNMPIPVNQEVLAKTIRAEVFDAIKSEIPEFTPDCYISKSELAFFRQKCLDSLFSEVEENFAVGTNRSIGLNPIKEKNLVWNRKGLMHLR